MQKHVKIDSDELLNGASIGFRLCNKKSKLLVEYFSISQDCENLNINEQNYWYEDYWYGYGYGINCRKLNKTKRVCARSTGRKFKRCISYKTVKIDEIRKIYSAQSTLKKNNSSWYLLTSYPK